MFKKVMGKYPPPLDDVLKDTIPGEPKRCVDLGCGSGSWYILPLSVLAQYLIHLSRILDVARDYPNCLCLAVDLVPMQNT